MNNTLGQHTSRLFAMNHIKQLPYYIPQGPFPQQTPLNRSTFSTRHSFIINSFKPWRVWMSRQIYSSDWWGRERERYRDRDWERERGEGAEIGARCQWWSVTVWRHHCLRSQACTNAQIKPSLNQAFSLSLWHLSAAPAGPFLFYYRVSPLWTREHKQFRIWTW